MFITSMSCFATSLNCCLSLICLSNMCLLSSFDLCLTMIKLHCNLRSRCWLETTEVSVRTAHVLAVTN